MPAGAWESRVLAARVADYDSQWLDHLFLAGEAMWGRLRPPRRDESDGPSMAALTRTVPISLLLREDLAWLLPDDRTSGENFARGNAQQVLEALTARGALFFNEIKLLSGLLPAHLEESLRELAVLGLITSDAFAAVRSIVEESKKSTNSHRRRYGRSFSSVAPPSGRWSLFPGHAPLLKKDGPQEPSHSKKAGTTVNVARLERWCHLLLRRYGVIFRDVLARESAAPAWHELVPVLRRLEFAAKFAEGVLSPAFPASSSAPKRWSASCVKSATKPRAIRPTIGSSFPVPIRSTSAALLPWDPRAIHSQKRANSPRRHVCGREARSGN